MHSAQAGAGIVCILRQTADSHALHVIIQHAGTVGTCVVTVSIIWGVAGLAGTKHASVQQQLLLLVVSQLACSIHVEEGFFSSVVCVGFLAISSKTLYSRCKE